MIVSAPVCSLSLDRQVLWVPLYFLLPDQLLLGQLPFVKNVRIEENFWTLEVKVCQLWYIENDAEFIHLFLIFDPQASVLNCPFRGFKTVQQLPECHQLLDNMSLVTLVKIITLKLNELLTVTYFCKVWCLLQTFLKPLPLILYRFVGLSFESKLST